MKLVGNTPLFPLHFEEEEATIYAKAEFLNPSGSIKDRLARAIVEEIERDGRSPSDTTILECSSGNTGIALALHGAARGYTTEIWIPSRVSSERIHILRSLGANLRIFEPGSGGYGCGIEHCRVLAEADSRYFWANQFSNPLNARDHERTTAPEIESQLAEFELRPGCFVTGFGTGGTLMGVGRYLRRTTPEVGLYAMRPQVDTTTGLRIEGVAPTGFTPDLLDTAQLDGFVEIGVGEALQMTRRLIKVFGLFVGTSSGANVAAALRLHRRFGGKRTVVTVLCDRADRYYSTALFQPAASEHCDLVPCI